MDDYRGLHKDSHGGPYLQTHYHQQVMDDAASQENSAALPLSQELMAAENEILHTV